DRAAPDRFLSLQRTWLQGASIAPLTCEDGSVTSGFGGLTRRCASVISALLRTAGAVESGNGRTPGRPRRDAERTPTAIGRPTGRNRGWLWRSRRDRRSGGQVLPRDGCGGRSERQARGADGGSGSGCCEPEVPRASSRPLCVSRRVDLGVAEVVLHAGSDQAFDVVVRQDRKSTRLNSSHVAISYAVFCLKKKISKRRKIKPTTSNQQVYRLHYSNIM